MRFIEEKSVYLFKKHNITDYLLIMIFIDFMNFFLIKASASLKSIKFHNLNNKI